MEELNASTSTRNPTRRTRERRLAEFHRDVWLRRLLLPDDLFLVKGIEIWISSGREHRM